MWNPDTYLAFADHRGRPFFDLLARVGAQNPRRVVDLGCGPGNLTVTLGERWPGAVIEAWDSSQEMVDAARERGVDARVGDVRDMDTGSPTPTSCVSNATLQWVPEHRELLVRWARAAGRGLVDRLPGARQLRRAVTRRGARAREQRPSGESRCRTSRSGRRSVDAPDGYADLLTDAGCTVDAWETTYLHELTGETSGAGLDHRHRADAR